MYPTSIQVEALRKLLGDHHDGLAAGEDPIAAENDVLVGRNVKVHAERPRCLLAPQEYFPERLEAVLDDQMPDRDLAAEELVPDPLFQSIWRDDGLGIAKVRSAVPALQQDFSEQ